jgi:hypothetical protein
VKFSLAACVVLIFTFLTAGKTEELTREQSLQLFERMKKLAGKWEGHSTKGWENWSDISVIARGSVVMSRSEFKDEKDLGMSTMIHMDGAKLKLTHYCMAGNQPTLVATSVTPDGKSVTFEFSGATDLPTRDHGHMDKVVYTFESENRFTSQWTWYQDGNEQWLEKIEYQRIGE